MSPLRVLIVGASVAGPTAAYWFAKTGAHVTVIERFPQLRTAGQNIDIRTAGVTVMRRMEGMEAAVRAKICPIDGISFVSSEGRPFFVMKATGNPDQQSLVSEYEIFRGDLARVLYDMTKDHPNVRYVFGEQIASMQQHQRAEKPLDNNSDGGPLTVEFANGYPTADYDLVVACDGATSRTRAMGFNCGVRDHTVPTNCWAAYFSLKGDLLNGSKTGQGYSAVGGRFLALGPDPSGVTRATLMSMHPFGSSSSSSGDITLPFREAAKQGDTALRSYVATHFRDAGWRSEEITQGLLHADDFYATEIVQLKPPHLTSPASTSGGGRVVLVGDAGYAPGFTGAGTTLALAGAYLLAGEVGAKHPNDLAAGLQGYEEAMQPLIKEMQKQPPFITSIMAPQTGWGIWVRNTIFEVVGKFTGVIEYVQRFWAPAFKNSEEFKLEVYEWRE